MRRVLIAAACLLLGCGAGAPARGEEAARLQAKLFSAQAVACLTAATQKACDPGLAAAFQSSPTTSAADRRTGSIWCEGGRPHARISTASGEMTGEFGQVVWEAIWRVLGATDSCASAYGGAVSVTRNGQTHACKDPRFDLHELFDMAHAQARTGPPVVPRSPRDQGGLCDIDPESCPAASTPPFCPPFLGDAWNGVTAKRDEGVESGADAGSEKADAPSAAEDPGRKPLMGEVVKALEAVREEARSCLKTGDPTPTASLVFRPDGAVQSVEVRNSGAPAKGCIERALRRAHVTSFSGANFAVSITLRAPWSSAP